MNMLDTNGKENRKSQQRNKRHKEEPNENFRMEEDSNRNKITLDGLYSRMEMTKERISEFEDITINIPQSE